MKINLRQRLRASHVKRWHIVETSRPQTVAEHSFNVCLFTEEICDRLGYDHHLKKNALIYALHHDIPEVVLGDIPTPSKEYVDEGINELGALIDPLSTTVFNVVVGVVKLADYLDAILFLSMYGVGKHAEKVRDLLIKQMWVYFSTFSDKEQSSLSPWVANICTWETYADEGDDVLWRKE